MIDNYSTILKDLIDEGFNLTMKSIEGYDCDCERIIPFSVPHCDKLQLYVTINIDKRKVYFYCRYLDGEEIGSNIEIIPESLDYPFIYWLREKIEERIRY